MKKTISGVIAVFASALLVLGGGTAAAQAHVPAPETEGAVPTAAEIIPPFSEVSYTKLTSADFFQAAPGEVTVSVEYVNVFDLGGPIYLGIYQGEALAFPPTIQTLTQSGLGENGIAPVDPFADTEGVESLVPFPSSRGAQPAVSRTFPLDQSMPHQLILWGTAFSIFTGNTTYVALNSTHLPATATRAAPEAPTHSVGPGSLIEIPQSDAFTYHLTNSESDDSLLGEALPAGILNAYGALRVTALPRDGFTLAPDASNTWDFLVEQPSTEESKPGGPDPETPKEPANELPGVVEPTPEPTPEPMDHSAVPAASEADLSPALEGLISAPGKVVPGAEVAIGLGTEHAGETVHMFMFSEPTYLGKYVVNEAGTISVQLPTDVTGSHRLAAYDTSGGVIGWQRITIEAGALVTGGTTGAQRQSIAAGLQAGGQNGLAVTGGVGSGQQLALALGLVLAGGLVVSVRRGRTAGPRHAA